VHEVTSRALLLRVWLEDGTGEFRARLTSLGTGAGRDLGEPVTVALASSPDEVCDAVRAWLHGFLGSEGDG
jgi:hypothetical protein